jgi:WD40 repeat protein
MRSSLLLLSLLLLQPVAGFAGQEPAKAAAPKVALISRERSDATKNLLDLAQVELSNDKGLVLLDRQSIDSVIAEQKLNLSGLVDANTAVKVGKLLHADMLAIVETGGAKNDAFGVVIYDTGTGMKFVDQSLPENKLTEQVAAIAEATRRAVEKRAKGAKDLKTISIMGIRNADLPRDRDATCRSLGMILERQLLGLPKIGVLERKRLEFLNKEKQLPTEGGYQELLTSMLVIDLEFSKLQAGKGAKATAILSNGTGKELQRVTIEAKDLTGADVVDPLVLGLLKFLKDETSPKPVDRVREAIRFVREGEYAWTHKDQVPAIEALEAGFALDPANGETRAKLAVYLSEHAARTLNPRRGTFGGTKPAIRAKPEDVNQSLRDTMRAYQLYIDDISHPGEFTQKSVGTIENRYMLTLFTYYLNNLAYLDERDVDQEGQALREEFFETYARRIEAQAKAWKEVVKRDPAKFGQFSNHVNQHYPYIGGAESKYVSRVRQLLAKNWLELSELPGVVFDLPNLPYHLPDMIPRQIEFLELYKEMTKHPHPVFRLHGTIGVLIIEGKRDKFGAAQFAPRYEKFKQEVKKTIEEAEKSSNAFYRHYLQSACYRLWYQARYNVKWETGGQQADALEVCEFMLAHKHVVREVLVPEVSIHFDGDPYLRQRFDLLRRALPITELPEYRSNADVRAARAELLRTQRDVLVKFPELRKLVPTPAVPWSEVAALFKTEKFPNLVGVKRAVIGDGMVYAAVLGQKDKQTFVQLVRVILANRQVDLFGKADIPYVERSVGFMRYEDHIISDICLSPNTIFVSSQWGILAFDRDGITPGQNITAKLQLPTQKIQSCAFFKDKLYAALEGGYLVEIDPKQGTFETLASSRRKEHLSPFDDGEAFRVPYIYADPERDRILFLLYQRPEFFYYPPTQKLDRPATNGLWEFNFKTKKFTKHFDLFKDVLNIGTLQEDGKLLLACHRSQIISSNAIEFDLKTNRWELLWSGYQPGPTITRDSARNKEHYETVGTPTVLRNDWIWHGLGRFSLRTGKNELYSQILYKPESKMVFNVEFLLPNGQDELLLGDTEGIWLFKLKPEKPVPGIEPVNEPAWQLKSAVRALVLAPDGKVVLAADNNGNIEARKLDTRKTLFSIAGKNIAVTALAISPKGDRFAAGMANGSIYVYSAEDGELLQYLPKQSEGTNCVAFSPDGKRIAAGYASSELVVWDAEKPVEIARCKGHQKSVTTVRFTLDGKQLVSGSSDQTIRVWDAGLGKTERAFWDKVVPIIELILINRGKNLLTLGEDRTIRVWDAASGKVQRIIPSEGDTALAFAVSPDEKWLATVSKEQRLRIWDLSSGAELRQTLAHSHPVTCVQFSSDGKQIFTGGEDRKIMIWTMPSDLVATKK